MGEFGKFLNKLPISAFRFVACLKTIELYFFNTAVILKIQVAYQFCLTLPKN